MDALKKIVRPVCSNLQQLFMVPSALFPATVPRTFSVLSMKIPQTLNMPKQLLSPIVPTLVPSCGFKVVGKPKKRCKDCYKVVRDQRLYVICKTKPRHKQMSMKKDEDKTWILTHATMGPKRPW
jgi:large subunit ribosomal protein L36